MKWPGLLLALAVNIAIGSHGQESKVPSTAEW